MASVDDTLASHHFDKIQAYMLGEVPTCSPVKTSKRSPHKSPRRAPLSNVQDTSRALHAVVIKGPKTAQSAPDMAALLQLSPSQTSQGHMRAMSFNGFPADGDTQPMPTQVYRSYKTFLKSPGQPEDSQEASTIREDGEAYQTVATPAPAGGIDLMEAWKTQTPYTVGDNTPGIDVHSIGDSGDPSASQGLLSSMKRDGEPKTPGLVGFKRDREGNLRSPTTVSRTPGTEVTNMFGLKPAQNMMTATQMFDNTQGVSSPIGDYTRSDPVDTRPSPEFVNYQATSPPNKALSSPSRALPKSTAQTGPRDFYKPMNESQEARRSKQALNMASSSKVAFDLDDEPEMETAAAKRVQHQRSYSGNLLHVRKSARNDRLFTRSRSEVMHPSPDAMTGTGKDKAEVIEIPDEGSEAAEEEEVEEESMDEYDEFSQGIVHSQRGSFHREDVGPDGSVPEEEEMHVAGSPVPDAVTGSPDVSNSPEITRGTSSKRPPQQAADDHVGLEVVGSSQPLRPPRLVEPSSLSSFVPGSQITGLSSQTRARILENIKDSDSSSLPKPPFTSQLVDEAAPPADIPSSPPAPVLDTVLQEVDETTARHESPPSSAAQEATAAHTNPTKPSSKGTEASEHPSAAAKDASAKTSAFETAATHITSSQSGPRPVSRSKTDATESPHKLGNLRMLGDIAKIPMSQETSGEIDISVAMDAVANKDEDFISLVKTPTKAKRNVVYGRKGAAFKSPAAKPSLKSTTTATDPSKRRTVQVDGHEEEQGQEAKSPTPVKSKGGRRSTRGVRITGSPDAEVSTKSEKRPPAADEAEASSQPPKKRVRTRKTPASATTVQETVKDAVLKSDAVLPADDIAEPQAIPREQTDVPTKPATTHPAVIEPNVETDDQFPLDRTPLVDEAEDATTPQPAKKRRRTGRTQHIAVTTEPRKKAPTPAALPTSLPTAADQASSLAHAAPADSSNRVLAQFRGNIAGYYPATCTSVRGHGPARKLAVRFDDDSETTLDDQHVCAFDLRVGDIVKVDLPGMRTNLYTVRGFEATLRDGIEQWLPDRADHLCAQVEVKRKDESKPTPKGKPVDGQATVPVSSIYITQTMWTKFSDRKYVHPGQECTNRQSTPSIKGSAPGTPLSRSRRQTLNSGHIAEIKSEPPIHYPNYGVFGNSAFAISSTADGDASRDHLAHRIRSNGGLVLSAGLHELFDIHTSSDRSDPDAEPLALKPAYRNLGFVALIADGHSRTQKYVQALALGLPTLHYKWVEDSISAIRPLSWQKYLLPAGESTYLHGAVRSRTLDPYSPVMGKLRGRLEEREKLLAGGGVLLLGEARAKSKMKGKDKADKREVYAFLSLALGAMKGEMVDSISEVKVKLGQGGWKWIHCPANTMRSVFEQVGGGAGLNGDGSIIGGGAGKVGNGRKRKRSSLVPASEQGDGDVLGEKLSMEIGSGIKVVSDEFVIQSLILGALIEE